MKIVLENHALVGAVGFSERADTDYLHHIDSCRLNCTLIKCDLHLVGSAISIAFPCEGEGAIGNRDTGQNERGIRRCAGKGGELPHECERAWRGQQADLPIYLAHIGGWAP